MLYIRSSLLNMCGVVKVDAECLGDETIARDACKQLAARLGGGELVEKEAYRSLEGQLPEKSF